MQKLVQNLGAIEQSQLEWETFQPRTKICAIFPNSFFTPSNPPPQIQGLSTVEIQFPFPPPVIDQFP
ncbi:MAG: hypothetical protein GY820_28800 [Gammaproteobacteria bacterium]|nr:hypothetical protein [Gammaproteobacteria bacterium]